MFAWNKTSLLISSVLVWAGLVLAADVDLKMTTSDGSTKVSFNDSGSVEVSSVTSDGDAYFGDVSLSGNTYIRNTETLQSGTTFYVSSATVQGPLWLAGGARASGVLARDNTTVTINNSTTETSVFSFTLPADLLETDRTLKIYLFGTTVMNNTGPSNNRRFTPRVKVGATTVFGTIVGGFTRTSTTRRWIYRIHISNNESASSQKAFQKMGVILDSNTNDYFVAEYATSSEDTSSAKTIDVTIQLADADANFTFTKEAAYAVIE